MTEGYIKNEIARAEEGPLTVNVSMNILSFLEVDELGQTMKVVFEMNLTWFDARLTMLHLQKDPVLNVLWERVPNIWYPKIHFGNIDPSKDYNERHLLYTILRDLNISPSVQNPGTTNARHEFNGSEHKIVRTKKYTYYWRCVYNLKWYPFDLQTCNMLMNLPKHYALLVRLNPESIEYTGNKNELTKYSVDKILLCSQGNGTELIFEVAILYLSFFDNFFFEVTLSRPLMSSILTIYLPTGLLLVIR